MKVKSLSHVRLFATQRTVTYQAPPTVKFSRQESWSGLPFPSPGDLPDPGMEPASFASPALAGGFLTTVPPGIPSAGVSCYIPSSSAWEFQCLHTLTNTCCYLTLTGF